MMSHMLGKRSEMLYTTSQENAKIATLRIEECVRNLLKKFEIFKANMNIKIHQSYDHRDHFPENYSSYSDEKSEDFHQRSRRWRR